MKIDPIFETLWFEIAGTMDRAQKHFSTYRLVILLKLVTSLALCLLFCCHLYVMVPSFWISFIFYYINLNKMHMLQSLFHLTTALHVSGITITHLQEHKQL
jgi:uncharacterized protein YqhQ